MLTFNIPYEELDIDEGRRQYKVNCISIKAINSAKFSEYKLPEKGQKAYAQGAWEGKQQLRSYSSNGLVRPHVLMTRRVARKAGNRTRGFQLPLLM